MRDNINSSDKRKDYTKILRPRPMAHKPSSLDGVSTAKHAHKTHSHTESAKIDYNDDQPMFALPKTATQPPEDDRSTKSLSLSLPNLRRPPDSGDLPSRRTFKWVFIGAFAFIFFVIGYGL